MKSRGMNGFYGRPKRGRLSCWGGEVCAYGGIQRILGPALIPRKEEIVISNLNPALLHLNILIYL